MNPLKRIATHFNVTIETFLNQVENHEAAAEAALRELAQATMSAKAKFHRVKHDAARLEERVFQLEEDRKRWAERAKKSREDEAKALECVVHLQRVEKELEDLKGQLTKSKEWEKQLFGELREMEQQCERLRRKKNQLASRQATAEAKQALDIFGRGSVAEVSEIFERWEYKVAGTEGLGGTESPVTDPLESEFLKAEAREAAKARLEAILKEGK